MKKLSKEKRDQLILIVMGTTIALAGLWYGAINPQHKKLDALAAQAVATDTKVNNAQRLLATSNQILTTLSDATQRVHAIESEMASGDKYSWVIFTINKFKDNYKVEIPNFSREINCEVGLMPKFPYKAVAFSLRGTAYYHDLGRFIADFENTFPYMRIQNLDLEPLFNPNSSASTATSGGAPVDTEKLSFRMEVVALVNPNQP